MTPHRLSASALWPRQPDAPASLVQCLALALLLHVLAIVLIGTAPGGSVRWGHGTWGALSVTLRGVDRDATPPSQLEAHTAPRADLPRSRPSPADSAKPAGTGLTAVPAAAPPPAAPARMTQPGPQPALPERPDESTAPPLAAPPMAAEPAPLPAADVKPPEPSPAPAAAPIERAATPIEREPAPPVEAPAPPTLAPAPPVALPAPPVPSPTPPVAAPVPRVATPVEVPQPAERPASQAAIETPAAPAPTPAPQLATPSNASAAPATTPAADTAAAPQPARAQPSAVPEPSAPRGAGSPAAKGPSGPEFAATPPSIPASAPRLNLDLPRSRGGEFSSPGLRGLLPLLPAPPERKSKLTEGIEKAARPDCRTAHSDKGLLAVVPLVGDAVKDKGCRW